MGHSPQATLLSQPRFLLVAKGLPPLSPGLLGPYAIKADKDLQLFFPVAGTTAGNEGLNTFEAHMLVVSPSVK